MGLDTGPLSPRIADTLSRVHALSNAEFELLAHYISQLMKWQAKTNLVSPSTLEEIWSRHVADSLQCVAIFPNHKIWVDLGSGGGLPGLVTAIVLKKEIGSVVHLVESNQKKAAFLRSVSQRLELNTRIHAERIESAAKRIELVHVVTARALAPLAKLLQLSEPLLENAIGLFHKGRDYRQELEDCSGLWKFDLIEHPSKIEDDSVLLEIRNLKRVMAQ